MGVGVHYVQTNPHVVQKSLVFTSIPEKSLCPRSAGKQRGNASPLRSYKLHLRLQTSSSSPAPLDPVDPVDPWDLGALGLRKAAMVRSIASISMASSVGFPAIPSNLNMFTPGGARIHIEYRNPKKIERVELAMIVVWFWSYLLGLAIDGYGLWWKCGKPTSILIINHIPTSPY